MSEHSDLGHAKIMVISAALIHVCCVCVTKQSFSVRACAGLTIGQQCPVGWGTPNYFYSYFLDI